MIFYTEETREKIKDTEEVVQKAKWWKEQSIEDLEGLIFSPSIWRSHFVLSYGDCPKCKGETPMYEWIIDCFSNPWKVECPHCHTLFPDNDYHAYYRSGLDEDGVFSFEKADQKLIQGSYPDDGRGFMGKHPDPYTFIAAYFLYGVWQEQIMGGIKALSQAYFVTQEDDYFQKTKALLVKLARFFPEYDYFDQGIMYEEKQRSHGYIGYWVMSSHDMMELLMAFDLIRDGLDQQSLESIQQNIFQDALNHIQKITTNYPYTDMTVWMIQKTLQKKQKTTDDLLDRLIQTGTKIDGVTGEKGVGGYTQIFPRALYQLFSLMEQSHQMEEWLKKYPILEKTFLFHIQIMYQEKFLPAIGDTGGFGLAMKNFFDVLDHQTQDGFAFTMDKEEFLFRLYEIYDNVDFLRAIYVSKNKDWNEIFSKDPHKKQLVKQQLEQQGYDLEHNVVDYEQYRLAMFFTGKSPNQTAFWINYDAGANHSHEDALNMGLFSKNLNMLPDNGYPPVNHGGWATPEVEWHKSPKAHNVVSVDDRGLSHLPQGTFLRYPQYGDKRFLIDTSFVKGIGVQAKEYLDIEKNQRMMVMVDMDEDDSYIIDVYRVKGGMKHEKFLHTNFAHTLTEGLQLRPVQRKEKFLQNMKESGYDASFDITFDFLEDEHVFLKHTEFTQGAKAQLGESWVDVEQKVEWIPTLIVKREGKQPLDSTFVSVMEPFINASKIQKMECIYTDSGVILKIDHKQGQDLIFSTEKNIQYKGIETDAAFCLIRKKADQIQKIVMAKGDHLSMDGKMYVDEEVKNGKQVV